MINLGQKPSKNSIEPSPSTENNISYPSFYCDRELGLTDKDLGKEITALVKLKLLSLSSRADKSGKSESSSFEVIAIEINPKKKSHYGK